MGNQIGTLIVEHKLSNGINCEIREAQGFANRSEIAFFIENECLGTFVIDLKRSGNIEVKPSSMRALRIKKIGGPEELPPSGPPNLDGVVSSDEDQNQEPAEE